MARGAGARCGAVVALWLAPDAARGQAPPPAAAGREHRAEAATRDTTGSTDPALRAAQGARDWLEQWGITPELVWTADLSTVRGGADSGATAGRWLLDAAASIDTERLLGVPTGRLFVDLQVQRGDNIRDAVGALQDVSNIDAENRTQLAKLWFEQRLFDDHLRYKVGKADANTDFAFTVQGARFLHPSYGFTPTIVGLPTYPDPGFGALVEVQPLAGVSVRAGVYDGAGARGVKTGERGPEHLWSGDLRLFTIAEASYAWGRERLDRLAIGTHYHDGTFSSPTGAVQRGASGFYAVLDQTLWTDAAPRGRALAAFAQYGIAPADVAPIDLYLGAGIVCTRPWPARADDACGFAANWAQVARGAVPTSERGELTLELFYTWQANDWLRLKPDLQWLPDPAAADGGPAWVFTLRAIVAF